MKTLIDLFKTFQKRGSEEVFIYRTGIRKFTFTYGQIYELSLKMAKFLEERGIHKGDRIALWAGNNPWWAICFFGIILKGGIVVPIDFISGLRRSQTITKLSGAKLIIQSNYKLEKITGFNSVMIEDLQFVLQDLKPLSRLPEVKPADIVELVYTSGTTGDPKGVALTHRNIITNIIQASRQIVIKSGVNFLSLLPVSHMFEQTVGFLTPLFRGDKIVYLRTLKSSSIMGALKEENIGVLGAVPRLLDLLKNTIERELKAKKLTKIFQLLAKISENKSLNFKKTLFYPIHKKFGKNFIMFISGGSALNINTAKFWKNIGFVIVEGYGLTECSPILAANTLRTQVLGSVGKPVSGVKIKIERREILAKGDNIFSGYFQNKNATQKAFDKNGWFKTGDEGYLDNEGNIFIKGRKKDIIVTSEGVNVYPMDIESILNYIPAIKESCVLGWDRGYGEEVHAVLILRKGMDAQKVISIANSKLDPQNQITSFSTWPYLDFPKTTTLKIQKYKVLQELKSKVKKEADVSEDALLTIIANLSSKPINVIKEESILTTDLGFTSISRLELINYIEQEFRVDLDDSIINQNTKVKNLREIIEKNEKNKSPSRFKFWTNSSYGIGIRQFLDKIFHFPFINYFFDLKAEGLENLKGLKAPVVFISNHLSYLDQPAIMRVLPNKWRYSTATAAREEFFFDNKEFKIPQDIIKRILFAYSTVAFNSFLLPQYSGFRKSLDFMGKLIDRNINILIFPEGHRSRNKKLQNFMPGLGLLVKELQSPVVPIKISGIENIFPYGARFPRRGKCKIIFGKALEFTTESPSEIVEKARKVVLDL